VTQNLVPAQQELKLQGTGEEKLFVVALQAPKVNGATPEELKQALRYAMVKIGLRAQNWPTDEEKEILFRHIAAQYGNHTLDEIRLAFDLALAGGLELLPGESVTCYENFSCLYFSSIMNAYRRWAAQAYDQLKPFEVVEAAKEEDISDEAMEQWIDETQKLSLPVDLLPVIMYEWLDKNGLIKKSVSEKNEYLQRAVAYRQGKLAKDLEENANNTNRELLRDFNQMKSSGEFIGAEVGILKSLAKKMILFDYLNGEL
jgi:hypothetical protein